MKRCAGFAALALLATSAALADGGAGARKILFNGRARTLLSGHAPAAPGPVFPAAPGAVSGARWSVRNVPGLAGVLDEYGKHAANLDDGGSALTPFHEGKTHPGTHSWSGATAREITRKGIAISGAAGMPAFAAVGQDLLDRPAEAMGVPVSMRRRPGVANWIDRVPERTVPGSGDLVLPGVMIPRDEPLPPGSAENLEARMKRRQMELSASVQK